MPGSDKKYRKFPKLIAHEIDGEFFVVNDTLGSIHSLGRIDSAVWRLLDEPQSDA